jgi:hypothetical protein
MLQTHKKYLRIQQHPASAFTAAIKNVTWTGQADKTSHTMQHYSTHSSVGTRMPARKLAPLDLANMPTDARYAKKCLPPTQTHTQLSQSAIRKRGPRDTPWAGSLVSKQMQELHRRLAEATVRLYGEGYEAIAIRLHSCICSPLHLVPMGCCQSSCVSRPGDDV